MHVIFSPSAVKFLKHGCPYNIVFWVVQDLFHVFLNNFEKSIFLLFFNVFILFYLHYVSVILKKREPLIKLFFSDFVRF